MHAKIKLFPVFERHLEFGGEGIIGEGWFSDHRKAYLRKNGYSL